MPTLPSPGGAAGSPREDPAVGKAKDNLMRSLAAYSVFCYVLQLKVIRLENCTENILVGPYVSKRVAVPSAYIGQ